MSELPSWVAASISRPLRKRKRRHDDTTTEEETEKGEKGTNSATSTTIGITTSPTAHAMSFDSDSDDSDFVLPAEMSDNDSITGDSEEQRTVVTRSKESLVQSDIDLLTGQLNPFDAMEEGENGGKSARKTQDEAMTPTTDVDWGSFLESLNQSTPTTNTPSSITDTPSSLMWLENERDGDYDFLGDDAEGQIPEEFDEDGSQVSGDELTELTKSGVMDIDQLRLLVPFVIMDIPQFCQVVHGMRAYFSVLVTASVAAASFGEYTLMKSFHSLLRNLASMAPVAHQDLGEFTFNGELAQPFVQRSVFDIPGLNGIEDLIRSNIDTCRGVKSKLISEKQAKRYRRQMTKDNGLHLLQGFQPKLGKKKTTVRFGVSHTRLFRHALRIYGTDSRRIQRNYFRSKDETGVTFAMRNMKKKKDAELTEFLQMVKQPLKRVEIERILIAICLFGEEDMACVFAFATPYRPYHNVLKIWSQVRTDSDILLMKQEIELDISRRQSRNRRIKKRRLEGPEEGEKGDRRQQPSQMHHPLLAETPMMVEAETLDSDEDEEEEEESVQEMEKADQMQIFERMKAAWATVNARGTAPRELDDLQLDVDELMSQMSRGNRYSAEQVIDTMELIFDRMREKLGD